MLIKGGVLNPSERSSQTRADILTQQPIKYTPPFCAPEALLVIGWNSRARSKALSFPFTEPGLCMNTRGFLSAHTGQTTRGTKGCTSASF